MLGMATPTRPSRVPAQSEGDRDLERVLALLRTAATGAVTVATLREQGIRAPGQAVYDLQVAGYVIDRVSWVGSDGQNARGYRLRGVSGDAAEPAAGAPEWGQR